MARMTKAQIEYLKQGIQRKVRELVEQKKVSVSARSPMAADLEQAVSHEAYVHWIRKQPKAVILSAMNKNGSISLPRPNRYHGDTIFTEVGRVIAYPEEFPEYNRFIRDSGALKLVEKAQKAQLAFEEYVESIEHEARAIIDKAVFAETPDGVAKAIEEFMNK